MELWIVTGFIILGSITIAVLWMRTSSLQYCLFAALEFLLAAYLLCIALYEAAHLRTVSTVAWLICSGFMVLMGVGSLHKAKKLASKPPPE